MKSSIISENVKEKIEYPCLMEYCGKGHDKVPFIVLMTAYKEGTVVFSDNPEWYFFQFYKDWDMNQFKLSNKQILLEN